MYDRMKPILDLARCKKVPKKHLGDWLKIIEDSEEYISLKSYYEEQSAEFWQNVELFGDCDICETLNQKKKALRNLWRKTHEDQNYEEIIPDSSDDSEGINRSSIQDAVGVGQ